MHRFHWLGIYALAVVLLIGCQSGPTTAPGSAATGSAAPSASAPSAAQPAGDPWDQVVAAAKQEGRLMVATNPGHRQFMEHAIPVFREEYGIEVETVYINGRETAERVLAEHGAGQMRIDVAVGGDNNLWDLAPMGVLESFTVPNTAGISDRLREAIGPDNTYYPQMLNVYALLVNTRVIPPERVPRRIADLADPYYKGKMVVHNPATTGGGNSWMKMVHEVPELGRPFLEKLAQQDLMIVQDPAGVEAVVARGERGIGVPAGGRALITQEGAPLRWLVPEEGVAFSIQNLSIPKMAPHPNAARVWVNFGLSKRVQEWWNDFGHYTPARADVELANPEFHLSNLPLLAGKGYGPPGETRRWLNVGKEIFGQ
jgi:iron(III) transport system substrate-binding protein